MLRIVPALTAVATLSASAAFSAYLLCFKLSSRPTNSAALKNNSPAAAQNILLLLLLLVLVAGAGGGAGCVDCVRWCS